MSKLRLKLYVSCIAFVLCPGIASPVFAISNQSVISLARENYSIATALESYPSITPIQEPNVEVEGADITLTEATITDAPSALEQALELGDKATEQSNVAASSEDWGNVSRQWLKAIDLLQQASQDEAQRSEASQKIGEYQQNLADSTREFFALSSGEGTTSGRARVGASMSAIARNNSPAFQDKKTEYDTWELIHRKNTLRLSFYSSIAIFALVVVIVIAGILLSYEQLRRGLSSETKFSVKGGTVELSSSIIGLLVLFISLAFFYLYLLEVYPIHEIGAKIEDNSGLTGEIK
ncbi:hypothetical protein [Phormidium tenue]|uniref:Uncharacterized protein n=1 Tax=Phormidium tenue NIES-30 TaxID=549789 RepID=A0A1U7IYK6_9CYAN|nr:hypothetical protein [Phormidium tenue]MBD2234786.1 hypothetical protein [Phormidium tenue FACHB-1052]OKH43880.1 hypothetical protein NIES30_24070 [Phormidium tenue NIES-30]